MAPLDVLTMGRIGVDMYPLQAGVSLREVTTFGKYLGGSPTNVAVAAARLGRRSGVITRTGADPFGAYLHDALRGFGVDDRFVTPVPDLPTPVTFCEIFPPDDFPLYFYRLPTAPDMQIRADEIDVDAVREAAVFWVTVSGLSQEPSRSATLHALEVRGRRGFTVLDLDYRPMFWPSREEARGWVRRPCRTRRSSSATSTRTTRPSAYGTRTPPLGSCTTHGVELAVVKLGPAGVLASRDGVTGRGAAGAGHRPQRPRRRRRVRRRAVPRPARRLGPGAHDAVQQRRRRHRRVAAGLRRRDAHRGRGRGAAGRGDQCLSPCSPGSSMPAVRRPESIAAAAAARRRPTSLTGEHGRMMIIAADHPARGALRAGADPLAMADRIELLDRVCVALSRPGVNGVLGTADILEDLLLLGALDDKVVVGSMNRGGLAGTAFEIDDRFTAYTAASIAAAGFEGGKMLLRIDPADRARRGRSKRAAPRSPTWPAAASWRWSSRSSPTASTEACATTCRPRR